MNDFKDFCEIKKGNKNPAKQCTKNLNIRRVNMPQITNKSLLSEFIKVCRSLNYVVTDDILLKGLHKLKVFTSQKEVNETKALQIPTNINHKIPVIMLKKNDEYMVFDGHHRWLAHHLKKVPLKILQIDISNTNQNLETSFRKINKELQKNKRNFHPGHSITYSRKNKPVQGKRRKTRKII